MHFSSVYGIAKTFKKYIYIRFGLPDKAFSPPPKMEINVLWRYFLKFIDQFLQTMVQNNRVNIRKHNPQL